MATRKARTGARISPHKENRTCRDCAHSYDWQSEANDGHLILCRCPFKMDGGKFCIFLSDLACDKFKERK